MNKLNFKDYYDTLAKQNPQTKFREELIKEFGISLRQFYYWLDHPSAIPELAKRLIAEKTGKTLNELFPETEKTV